MLSEFLIEKQHELIDRCRAKVAQRRSLADPEEMEFGIPQFLAQLITTLEVEQTETPMRSREVSGPSDGDKNESNSSQIGQTALKHGRELFQRGFTVDQVVHDYGDLCQAITDAAFETGAVISTDEFRTLNRCLDNGIAVAVSEYTSARDYVAADNQANELNSRLGFLAHELRNRLNSASLALSAIRTGNVGLAGATGAVLDRSLTAMRTLVDRSLAEARIVAGIPPTLQKFSLADFIAEARVSASLEAGASKCRFSVGPVDRRIVVRADRELLFAALGNVLQNAFKFTRPNTQVDLTARSEGDRILIEVQDACGGVTDDDIERMFLPFTSLRSDGSGLGVGLSIARRSVEANGGSLSVRNLPGEGCVFTIDLPNA